VLALISSVVLTPFPVCAETTAPSILFERQCFDLDSETVVDLRAVTPLDETGWDVRLAYHSNRAVHGVVIGNAASGVEIARIEDRSFDEVSLADVDDVSFSRKLLDRPAAPDIVYLVRTDRGSIFKLGRLAEADATVAFDFELLVPAAPEE